MTKIFALIFSFGIAISSGAAADIVIIVNQKNVDTLDRELVKNLFLGRKRDLPSLVAAKPVDQAEDRDIRNRFYAKLVNKDEAGMRTYWAQRIFTGNGSPPKALPDDAAVMEFVRTNPGAIGYVESKASDSSVRIVDTLK